MPSNFNKSFLKLVSPVTPGQRHLKILNKNHLWSNKFIKSRTKCLSGGILAGRNHSGKICVRHHGGGHKRLYRHVDFCRKKTFGVVVGLEHDPYRTALIARVYDFKSGYYSYILAPKNLFVGSLIASGPHSEIKVGHSLPFLKIPVGSILHNVSLEANKKGQYARSAGTFVQLIQKTKGYAKIRSSSGEQRLISLSAFASLGVVSNDEFRLIKLGKAGRSRWKNIRPTVRGVAMNPVDHPHGGGEGKTSGGRVPVTPWGKPTRGPKTSRSKKIRLLTSRK